MSFEEKNYVDPDYIELCIIKTLLTDKKYLVMVNSVFEPHYFDTPEAQTIYKYTSEYFKKYKEIPEESQLLNSVPTNKRESVVNYLKDISATEISIIKHYDWIMDKTDLFLKDKAIKDAINKSVEIIDSGKNTTEIQTLIENALSKNLSINLGLNYFDELGSRLKRIFTDDTQRLPTYFPTLDDYINGGFPPKTLSVFISKIHGFKSNLMANIIARQVMNGKNICLASLEMSEDMFAQRFDGIYSQLDINRFYFNQKMQKQLVKRLTDVKKTIGRGNLYIKAFPTGNASVNDFRAWVRELNLRGIEIHGFYFDYLNLMKPDNLRGDGGNTNNVMKAISEESRAMGFDFNLPMVSVTQLNRTGMFMDLSEVEFDKISDGITTMATADFSAIMGSNDEHMVYQNEVHYKLVKNRLGGRVGEMDKFYYDGRSLKMYDSSELDLWMSDVKTSGDDRTLKQQTERTTEQPKRPRKRKE